MECLRVGLGVKEKCFTKGVRFLVYLYLVGLLVSTHTVCEKLTAMQELASWIFLPGQIYTI